MRVVTKSFLRYLQRRISLSILQLMGIAFGVAAVIGMTMSAQTAIKSFNKAIEFLCGKSTHSIQRHAGPMEESILIKLAKDPSVICFSPVIERRISLNMGDTVRILGIDPFLDKCIRPEFLNLKFLEEEKNSREAFFSFLINEREILIDHNFKEKFRDREIKTEKGPLIIKGSFPNPSGEPLIIMDIGNVQKLYHLEGYIDRVDLILSDEKSFRSRWEKGFLIQSSKERSQTFSGMLRAFRLNLEALSLLALLVGIFLIYNTSMFAVVSRRRDGGILRSLGAKRLEIFLAFLSELLMLGGLGGVFGGFFGFLLTRFLTNLIGNSISNLYFFLKPEPIKWSIWILIGGIALGCGASLLGGGLPLIGLIRMDPGKAVTGRVFDRESTRKAKRAAVGGIFVLILSFILFILPGSHVYIGFSGVFGVILGISLLTGLLLIILYPIMRKILSILGGLPGRIASGNIRQNLGRTSVAIAAFMISLSMSIGLSLMIESFRQSLIWWMNSQIRGDLYIGKIDEAEIPEDFYEELKKIDGIDGVHPYRNVQTIYQKTSINVSAVDPFVLERFARFGWVNGGDENWEEVKRGGVIVSESFSRRFKIKTGDFITLEGVRGLTNFKVGAIFYDYTTEHGLIMMDRRTYIKTFGDRTLNNIGIFIDTRNPRRIELLEEVKKRANARGFPIMTGTQLHQNILKVFDETFAVTRSMRAIAIIVAFFGIAGALLTLFIERSREFGIYRGLGFSTSQVSKMTLMESLGMGFLSFIISIGIGSLLSILLIKVINLRSFNWTIFYYPSWRPFIITGITALLASFGASLYPIWKVYKTYPQIQLREE